ncbi:MAG: PLP-dependent aminotransferase family protein [Flavobacteriales bacterium]|nr:PLP-dependent aminotransferase family protein [Flavobacteriales bacterium]
MFPFKTSITFDRKSKRPLYLQLSNQIIELIRDGVLASGTKLPGSRILAEQLEVHRKTIVACYDELLIQGWVVSIPKKGTFVQQNLPVQKEQILGDPEIIQIEKKAGFSFYQNGEFAKPMAAHKEGFMYLDDGVSDGRLTPLEDIARTYRRICSRQTVFDHLSYGSRYGNNTLREALVQYLNASRGLNVKKENILITRGSQMGIWLSAQLLLQKNDSIIVGATNYASADYTFLNRSAKIERVSVDKDGIVTDEVEELCKRKRIRALYVTSHHHHPTTVTLSAQRRIHLLNLAKKFGFAIIEDDYDYDFNYNHAPILPLASHDANGNVIYIGSVCKTVAPVFRIGYLIAPKEVVDQAAKIRGLADRQGDALLELTFADFIKSGDLDRHIRKVMKVYKARRDLFCSLFKEELGNYLDFEIPMGGMAIWVKLNTKYSWKEVARVAKKQHLEIGDWSRYDGAKQGHNSIRIGFASYNEEEVQELVRRLKRTFEDLE